MHEPQPSRQKADLAEMVEMLLDKGIVVNADIAVTVGETELLGVKLRAAIASFETAAQYGLEFPTGTDMERVEAAAGVEAIDTEDAEPLTDQLGLEEAAASSDADDGSPGEQHELAEVADADDED